MKGRVRKKTEREREGERGRCTEQEKKRKRLQNRASKAVRGEEVLNHHHHHHHYTSCVSLSHCQSMSAGNTVWQKQRGNHFLRRRREVEEERERDKSVQEEVLPEGGRERECMVQKGAGLTEGWVKPLQTGLQLEKMAAWREGPWRLG